jgi:16S rRNA (guanine527-N7)-methyltransferase
VKLDPEAVLSGLKENQVEQLRAFGAMVAGLGADLGLVSAGDRDRVWERHILDSLRSLSCLVPTDSSLADVGSGGGLPGVPLAVARPEVSVTLIESRGGRVAFLEKVVQDLGLGNARVVHARAEDHAGRHDVCTARALANPVDAWRLASPLLSAGGRLIYFAGRSFGESDLAELAGRDVVANICATALFPGSGSLVIMQFGS